MFFSFIFSSPSLFSSSLTLSSLDLLLLLFVFVFNNSFFIETDLPARRRRRRGPLLLRLLDLPQLQDQPGRPVRFFFFSSFSFLSSRPPSHAKKNPEKTQTRKKNLISVSKPRRANDSAAEHKGMEQEGKDYKKNLYRSIGSMGSP